MTSLTGSMGPTGGNVGSTSTGKWAGDKIPKGYKVGQLANYDPQQMGVYNRGFEQVAPDSYLSRLASGDQGLLEEMERPALRQFGALQGNIASRFSAGGGKGSLGNRRSSGFQNEMGGAASDFAQQLQAQRQNLQRQAIMDLHGMSQKLLSNRPYERNFIKKQENPWAGIVGQFAGAIPGLAASLMGGGSPQSAIQGASSIFGGGGGGGWGTSPNYGALTQGYNQELRMNPEAFGY